jgi:LacI family transcriptional regulator
VSHEESRPGGFRATIADVASRAGVSKAAVSVVLNEARGTVRVSADTRARILAAAEELGYSPDLAAKALRRRRSGLIGLIHRGDRDSFPEAGVSYRLGDHIARAAAERGYHTLHATPTGGGPAELLLARRVEGVIVENPTRAEAEGLLELGLPIVQVLRPCPGVPASTVTVDPGPGFREALGHLAALGHRTIGLVGNDRHPTDAARVEAHRAALAALGLAAPEGAIQLRPDNRLESGYDGAGTLLALPEPPTAILAAAESTALGVLRCLYEEGLRIPSDVSVIGYDDVAAAGLYPPLTSIAQPLEALAGSAVEMVAQRAEESSSAIDHIALPAALVVRASTAAPHV